METGLGALVLAAGSSRRMGEGRLKQLLPLGGRPALVCCVETLGAAGLVDIVVVASLRVFGSTALAGLPVEVVLNAEDDSDMAASVRMGLAAIDPAATGVLVHLADHPLLAVSTVRALVGIHRVWPERILIPSHDGRRGHPAIFPAALIREVRSGATLREVTEAHRERVVECAIGDPGVVFDMDTWDQYQTARDLADRPALRWYVERGGNA